MAAVLVIDDDPGTRATFGEVLRHEGFTVCTAETGRGGLQLLQQRAFDVAVVDVRLPDFTGVALLRTVRAARISVPFVFVTGFGTVSSAVEAMQLGARYYLEKPLWAEQLVQVVQSCLLTSVGHEAPVTPPLFGQVAEPYVARALQLIDLRYRETAFSSRSLAAEVGISREHLCRLIKQHTAKSLGSHLHGTRIRQAQRFLSETSLTTKEIATLVGYQRANQLDRHFRRFCGLTPTQYRRQARLTSSS